jgi:hypothetical protein
MDGSAQSSVVPRAGRKARQFEGVSNPGTEACKQAVHASRSKEVVRLRQHAWQIRCPIG